MVIRVVVFAVPAEAKQAYEKLVVDQIQPVNRDFGCDGVYTLSESASSKQSIISLWSDLRKLESMRESQRYKTVLQQLKKLVGDGLEDRLFEG